MKCKNCGQELGERVKICPICQAEQGINEVGNRSQEQMQEGLMNEQEGISKIFQQDYLNKVSLQNEMSGHEKEVLEEEVYEHQKSRLIAGLLQLFLGGFGAGRFYLGYTGVAVGQLCTLPLFGIGYIWGFIDGILILCGQLDLDADGVPLKG